MAEITPLGVTVQDARTNVHASANIPGTREVLENTYNDFLDAKQKEQVELDMTFDAWIGMSVRMLKFHRRDEIRGQYEMGQISRAEYEALEEVRNKLIRCLEHCEPRSWGFDQYGLQYVQPEQRQAFKEKVGQSGPAMEQHRDVHIKSSKGNS